MKDENKGSTIFIVEDDIDLAEMLTAYFEVQGYTVNSAPRGEDAVKAIANDPPDVVVLDIRLPDIDGYEVCRRLRQMRRTNSIPIIFLTEKREREDKLAGLELGAVDYITKPFDIQELRLRIRNSLRRKRLNTLTNPVTGLPEGELVQKRLEEIAGQSEWGIVLAGIRGLERFRDKYGFVAADDVSRAVTLMISNAVQESGTADSFMGHTDAGDFVILTSADNHLRLAERCRVRLEPSIQYFYPALERPHLKSLPAAERLSVRVSHLSSREHQFSSLENLFAALESQD